MPTYAQLNLEAAWRAEHMPEPMAWFCRELAAALGIPQANVGAKGDNASGHMKGGHRSQRWILTSRYCTNRSYTVYGGLPEVLLDALGAIDVTPASREQMLLICQRLDAAARAGLIEEVVAWYGNTNNDTRVDGYDNVANRVASSDSSHLWHLHVTFNRWAVADRAMFERLFKILTGRSLEDDVQTDERNWLIEAAEAARKIPGIEETLAELMERPAVEATPIDAATLKAALLDPDVRAVLVDAVREGAEAAEDS